MITHKYYVVDAEISKSLEKKILAERKKASDKFNELFSDFNSTGEFYNYGIYVNSIPEEKGYIVEKAGNCYFIKPDKRYKAGKEFYQKLKKMKEVSGSCFDTSEYINDNFKISTLLVEPPYVFSTISGFAKGRIVVKIPYSQEQLNEFPKIPDSFKEIKKSEFIAMTEE